MSCFVTQVALRWTDQDVYRHVNNARAVTLLEEARVAMVFDAAEAAGVSGFRDGLLSWACTSTTAVRSRTAATGSG